ncbi:MAG: ABC transporter permease [Blastocatellia bacterium]
MSILLQDLRYGLRMMGKKPSFTIVAVITLALGIGANTAIFSLINGLLLRPLPYRDSERLALIWTHSPGANVAQDWPSPGQYSAVVANNSTFEEIAIIHGTNAILAGEGAPERLGVVRASSNLYSILGARPALGRVFLPEEDVGEKATTVILSYGLWQQRFGGDPNVLGRALTLNGDSFTVVGVMSQDFSLGYEVVPTVGSVEQADLLLPLPMTAESFSQHGDENYNMLARLKPGVSIQQAQSELDAVVRGLEQQYPDYYPASRRFSFSVRPLLDQVVGDVRPALLVLLGAVGCVLLIACANVANLMLARAATREREMAIRTALGAGRWRVVRQLLTESLLLAVVGGALGLLIAIWSLDGLRWLNPGNIPRLHDIHIDGRVLAFTFTAALLTGVLFGLVPALRSSRINLNETLKEGGRSMVASGNHRLRNLLVVAEMALSLILLIGAGLLIRSFLRVQQVEPGFSPQNVLSLRLSTIGTAYAEESRRRIFYQQLWERLGRLPGVESVGGGSVLPLSGGIGWGGITIEGYDPAASGQEAIQADQRYASVGYFETMKVPLISGRFFGTQDTKDSLPVAIIDEKMARTYWPGADAVGKRLKRGGINSKAPWLTVVGVVASVRQYALDTDSRVAFYTPHEQTMGNLYVVVRTTNDPRSIITAVTDQARAMDPNVPIYDVKTMDQRVSESLARRRFAMVALGLFAVVAMTLAGIGIYGVMSYTVTERTREIGIRMALGSPTRDVLKVVIGQGMALAGIGVALGLAGAFAATRLMASLLYGVSATDPLTFAVISLVLTGVALAACFVPARRATRVDPMIALRYE